MLQCFEITTEDKPGVLARIAGIVGARGENIARVMAAPAGPGVSRIVVLVDMSGMHAEFVCRKLLKIVHVLSVCVQLAATAGEAEILEALDLRPARTIDRAMWPAIELARKTADMCLAK
jgi:acetolactate synthase small subunit